MQLKAFTIIPTPSPTPGPTPADPLLCFTWLCTNKLKVIIAGSVFGVLLIAAIVTVCIFCICRKPQLSP